MLFAATPAMTIPWNLAPDQWAALFVLFIVMVVCAYIDGTQYRVPNNITFPTILLGWLYGFVRGYFATPAGAPPVEMVLWPTGLEFTLAAPWGEACYGFWCAVKLTFLGIGAPLLLLFYAIGGMGGGDVKMQMGFGSWCATIFGYALGWQIVFFGFCLGALIGGVIAMIMVWRMGTFVQNKENFKEILGDLVTSKSVTEVADRAAVRRKGAAKLPYGVPLAMGFLSYVVLDYFGFWAWFWTGSLAG